MRTSTRMSLAAGWAVALAAVPLAAVFSEWRWIWYAWAAVGAVVSAHLLARSARLPAMLVPPAGALGLLVYLTVVFAGNAAPLGLVPSPASLAVLREALASGMADVNEMAAPVPATPGLVLLTAASVGALAIVVDLIAVSLRRPAASGLALLALYAVPTAVRQDSVPWVLFAIGATGYLVLLLVEGRDRLLRWGRPIRTGTAGDEAPLPLTGQRIGATAIALAVILPLFVPGLTGNTLSRLSGTGNGESGNGSGSGLNEFAALRGQLQRGTPLELLRAQTDLAHPFYLRTKVLDRYQASGFAGGRERGEDRVPGGLSAPAGQRLVNGEERYWAEITLTDGYSDDHLPLYYYPDTVQDVQGHWSYDVDNAVVFSRQRHGNFQYRVTGTVPEPSEAVLAAASAVTDADRRALPDAVSRRPGGLPGVITATVQDIVGDRPTPYLKAKALNDYFTDGRHGFTYALNTLQGNSGNALVDFLGRKQGYCEQYAAAMAVMLRVADIPSRVVLGYTTGKRQEDGSYVVTTSDAHAWVEAYFHDVGWVPFDPTPLQDGRTVGLPYAPRPSARPTSGAGATTTPAGSPGATPNKLDPNDVQPGGTPAGPGDTGVLTPRRALIGAGLLAVLLGLLTPATVRLAARRRRLRTAGRAEDAAAAARAAWDEVVGTAADYGVELPRTETPRGLAQRLGRELSLGSTATAGLRLVALAEERARYAARPGVDGDLATAVRAVRRGLRAQAGRGQRWRAVLVPPSTVRAARSGSAVRAATASAALHRLGETVRRPVTPRRR